MIATLARGSGAGFLALALLLGAACTSEPSAKPAGRPSPPEAGPYSAFAGCLRDRGIDAGRPIYSGGRLQRWIDLPPESSFDELAAAADSCTAVLPPAPIEAAPPISPEFREAAFRFASCMRSNGVPDFPDPTEDGGLTITPDINPNSRVYVRAEGRCERFFEDVE